MKAISLGRERFAIVDDEDFEHLSQWKWCTNGDGYAGRNVPDETKASGWVFITMHLVLMGKQPGKEIDHINGDKLDNRRANLRFVTRSQNQTNRPILPSIYKKQRAFRW